MNDIIHCCWQLVILRSLTVCNLDWQTGKTVKVVDLNYFEVHHKRTIDWIDRLERQSQVVDLLMESTRQTGQRKSKLGVERFFPFVITFLPRLFYHSLKQKKQSFKHNLIHIFKHFICLKTCIFYH